MAHRKPFSLYPRKTPGGKIVWYYRTYDENGARTTGKSTGQTSKTAAQQYINTLIKKDALVTKGNPSFEQFALDWWVWDKCGYIKNRLARGISISRTYTDIRRLYLVKHILPFFKSYKLQTITPRLIEKWMMDLLVDEDKKLSPTTINQCFATLRIMLKEAERLNYIPKNPCAGIGTLGEDHKEKGILTAEEIRELFREDRIKEIWDDQINHYTMNMLSACTGMRMGEVQALQVQYVFPDYVVIQHSWTRKYGIKDPKWHSVRAIPIPGTVSKYLSRIIEQSPFKAPDDLVFYGADGKTPVYHKTILKVFYLALERIEIPEAERVKRNITFHSWRHFFNTFLRNQKIPDSKLRKLTGHRTEEMTEHYTHFQLEDFQDVAKVQEGMF